MSVRPMIPTPTPFNMRVFKISVPIIRKGKIFPLYPPCCEYPIWTDFFTIPNLIASYKIKNHPILRKSIGWRVQVHADRHPQVHNEFSSDEATCGGNSTFAKKFPIDPPFCNYFVGLFYNFKYGTKITPKHTWTNISLTLSSYIRLQSTVFSQEKCFIYTSGLPNAVMPVKLHFLFFRY